MRVKSEAAINMAQEIKVFQMVINTQVYMEMENLKDWGYINGTMGQFTKANFKTELGMVVADGNLEDRFIRDNM